MASALVPLPLLIWICWAAATKSPTSLLVRWRRTPPDRVRASVAFQLPWAKSELLSVSMPG
ncbi:hypothetical protein D3C81_2118120 [compost metagenome]